MDLEMQELLIHRPFSKIGDITWKVSIPERRNQLWRKEGKPAKQPEKGGMKNWKASIRDVEGAGHGLQYPELLGSREMETEPSNELHSTDIMYGNTGCSISSVGKQCMEVQRWQRLLSFALACCAEDAREKNEGSFKRSKEMI